jgi:cytochrome c6
VHGLFARGGLALLGLLVLAACGSSQRASRKNAVNDYITRVDAAEAQLLGQVGQINLALGRFSVRSNTPAEIAALAQAHTAIAAALRRVRVIPPPPDARALRADLLALLSRQESVAGELVSAARFGPRFLRAVRPLGNAAARLGRDLAAVTASASATKPAESAPTGAQLWTAAGCGACHTLAAAGSNGSSGPDLDQLRPSSSLVSTQVRSGGPGMPSYAHSLSGAELASLAAYVAGATRGAPPAAPSGRDNAAAAYAAVDASYAAAFDRYRQAIVPLAATVSQLRAPPLLQPGLTAERRALERSILLCAKIKRAFSRGHLTEANTAIKSLFATVAGVGSARVRREEVSETRAYNARLAKIRKLTVDVATERNRLLAEIG